MCRVDATVFIHSTVGGCDFDNLCVQVFQCSVPSRLKIDLDLQVTCECAISIFLLATSSLLGTGMFGLNVLFSAVTAGSRSPA